MSMRLFVRILMKKKIKIRNQKSNKTFINIIIYLHICIAHSF